MQGAGCHRLRGPHRPVRIPTFSTFEDVRAAAEGTQPYLWETSGGQPKAFQRSRARAAVLCCLARNPEERPSCDLLRAVDYIGNATMISTDSQEAK